MYTIRDMPDQVPQADLDLLSQVETATVGHWRLMGFMNRAIQPLLPGRRVVGTAITLAIAGPDSTLLHHATGLLRPGDILVVDRLGDDKYACWGGGVTVAAKAAGAKAGVVDGPCTDIEEIEVSDFPLWARGLAPITTRLYDLGGRLNKPVAIGGVVVMPGDAVLCDDSGVLILSPSEAEGEAKRAIERQEAGLAMQRRVQDGAKLGELSGATAKVVLGA